MRYCHRFHDYLYLDHYNGRIFICPWMNPDDSAIGNLFLDDIYDAYNSACASHLRSTMDDQTFRYCRREACPHIQNDDLEEITPLEYTSRKRETYHPVIFNLAYDFVCNQSCETCRESVFIPPPGYAEKMCMIREKITPYLRTAKQVSTSGHGDPFASKYMMEVLENLRPMRSSFTVLLETNGVFFDEEHWERIKHLKEYNLEIVVTINSFDKFTYNNISRGGNYAKVLHNLEFISHLRKNEDITVLSNSFVIQDRNFREIPLFIERSFNEYAFDKVVLKPVYQWGTMEEDVYWFKDVLNPLHPYHQEYLDILNNPILDDYRVYNFGGDKVHEKKTFPLNNSKVIFPYNKIERHSRIVVYGAGQVGCDIVNQMKLNRYCEVVLRVDKVFDNECIMSPEILYSFPYSNYDYIVLATRSGLFADEMKNNLLTMGVPEERIVLIDIIGKMPYNHLFPQINLIFSRLQDELSRKLFLARVEYSLTHAQTGLYQTMTRDDYMKWANSKIKRSQHMYGLYNTIWQLRKENCPVQKNDIFFIAVDSESNWHVERFLIAMEGLGIKICRCIRPYSSDDESDFYGIPCISEVEFLQMVNNNTRIVVGLPVYNSLFKEILDRYTEYKEYVVPLADDLLPQYFESDILLPKDNEILVDVGAYDLTDTLSFYKWASKGYKKIYAFEPDPTCYLKCKEILESAVAIETKKVELVNKGLSCKRGTIDLPAVYDPSGISKSSKMIKVDVISLDEFLNGRPATFIKMDVEGAEMDVLAGMEKTIKQYKPKLAVCIYHKHEDLYEIMSYILSLVPEYKCYIRHYTSTELEEVLLCEI